jgi:hypothetical protein
LLPDVRHDRRLWNADKGQAGLIVVYATNMNDQINAAIDAENKYISDSRVR